MLYGQANYCKKATTVLYTKERFCDCGTGLDLWDRACLLHIVPLSRPHGSLISRPMHKSMQMLNTTARGPNSHSPFLPRSMRVSPRHDGHFPQEVERDEYKRGESGLELYGR
jgi:hypothetical protein